MPDCRAYELVSPAYAGGSPSFGVQDISPDGEHVLLASGGGFAEVENLEIRDESQISSIYGLSRTATGWRAEALDPAVSLFPRRDFRFPSTDLSRMLFDVAPPHGGEELHLRSGFQGWELAVREPPNGEEPRFTLLGPMLAPSHECEPCLNALGDPARESAVVGAAADLSRVFFVVEAKYKQLWPGDQTIEGGQSLYEYRRAEGQEPVLVGVGNNVGLAGSQHINEGAQLESECGTIFDAAGADGETVYFTGEAADKGPGKNACNEAGDGFGPPVEEIYARLGGARTVSISEPTHAECEACNTSSPASAVFQGSSEDGSRVFFTTEQDLLPGGSGNSLFEYDATGPAGSRVSLIASDVTGVQSISRDGSRVYFTSLAELSTEANGNGERASEVTGEKLYMARTQTSHVSPVFVAGEPAPTTYFNHLGTRYVPEATRDGGFFVFLSERKLLGTNDSSTIEELFEYNAQTGRVSRASAGEKAPAGYECPVTHISEPGYNCDGNTASQVDEPTLAPPPYRAIFDLGAFRGEATAPGEVTHALSVAENGAVAFHSRLALTPGAVPGREYARNKFTENVYEYRSGQTYLISAADESAPQEARIYSRLAGVDESGSNLFLFTTDSLVPQDTDSEGSIYDAREQGGFPAPALVLSCSGGECQAPVTTPPTFAQAPSTTQSPAAKVPAALTSPSTPKTAAQLRAEKLAKALRACKKKHHAARAACERRAQAKYDTVKQHTRATARTSESRLR